MGIAQKLIGKVKKGMGHYGEKVVAMMADTSSDAPTRFSAPKRDLYEKLEADRKQGSPGSGSKSG
jgi:hypothetical protein